MPAFILNAKEVIKLTHKQKVIARITLWLIRFIGGNDMSGDLVEELRRIATHINIHVETDRD